jgi:hypothetical protein
MMSSLGNKAAAPYRDAVAMRSNIRAMHARGRSSAHGVVSVSSFLEFDA